MTTSPLLIFDLGNVIVRHDNALLESKIVEHCPDPARCKAALAAVMSSSHGISVGTSTLAQFFAEFQPAAGFTGDFATFEELWNCHFTDDPAMEELVRQLAAKYRLVVLSNTNQSHWDHILARYLIMDSPAVLYASFEMGVAKPDPAIYRQVLAAEGYDAKDAIFIDDSAANVEGARAVGMTAIHFTGRAALEAELMALGVEAG
jgi:HAD superfamily hydrolase (TIGR01549 family)